jgi:hypothetical protein
MIKFISKASFVLLLCGILLLAGCKDTTPKKIFYDDVNLYVGQTQAIILTFEGERDAVTYSDYDETIIQIKNGMVKALSPGTTTVKITGNNTGATGSFKVTVSYEPGVQSMEGFNRAGTFDEEDPLSLWTITGTTAERHIVEIDEQGGNATYAFKLWYEDLAAIDVTLSYLLEDMPAGVYTFTMQIRAGNLGEVTALINDSEYKWTEGQIYTNKNTTYLVYELAEDGDIDFSLTVTAAAVSEGETGGWGFIDDIAVEKGDTAPENLVNSMTVNYSFEDGLEGWTVVTNDGFLGQLTENSTVASHSGAYGVNYWGAAGANDSLTISQIVSSLPAGTYRLSICMIVGCDNTSVSELQEGYIYIKNYDGADGVLTKDVKVMTGWNNGDMVVYTLDNINVTNATVEVGLVLTMGANTVWIHFDDFILESE